MKPMEFVNLTLKLIYAGIGLTLLWNAHGADGDHRDFMLMGALGCLIMFRMLVLEEKIGLPRV